MTYADEAYNEQTAGKMTVNLWNAVMKKGIITFPRPQDCPMHRTIHDMEIKPFGIGKNMESVIEAGEVK